ncbi:MAG: cation diffusion facilitator family transporter [Calditrichaceae bacterium]|jgi:cation diffusion facilitator family transporter
MTLTPNERLAKARRVTWIGLIWNVFLTILKFIIGIISRSNALIADAVHSLSDFASDISVLIGLKVASKPVDHDHNYGHGKFETLSAIIVGITLFAVGIGILWNSATIIYDYFHGKALTSPGASALIALVISILVKEGLYQYTAKSGKTLHSQVLIANAWHHRSDAFSSIAVLIGVSGAILLGDKWVILDPVAAGIVSLLILKVAGQTGYEAFNELMEVSLSRERQKEILDLVSQVPGVNIPHNLKTRQIGNTVAIDLHIKVDNDLSIVEAHDISTSVEDKLKESFGEDSFISIHVEPLME